MSTATVQRADGSLVQVPIVEPTPVMLDCGHMSTPSGLASGYARKLDNTTLCYECAAELDRETVREGGDLWAYVRKLDYREIEIITWPGIVLGHGRIGAPTPMLGGRCQFAVVTIEGVRMHGRHYPNAGDYIHLRPYKDQPART